MEAYILVPINLTCIHIHNPPVFHSSFIYGYISAHYHFDSDNSYIQTTVLNKMHSNPIAARVFLVVSEIVYYTQKFKYMSLRSCDSQKKWRLFRKKRYTRDNMEPDQITKKQKSSEPISSITLASMSSLHKGPGCWPSIWQRSIVQLEPSHRPGDEPGGSTV